MALDYYSIWPFFACLIVLVIVASARLFQQADVPPSGHRHRQSNLDGLRGFLAMAVFFQHAAIYHQFLLNGAWIDPPQFYFVLGQIGVSLFFMITGYLFWGKLVDENGRPEWLRLYVGRVFRIGPVFYFAVAVLLVIVFASTGLHMRVSPSTLLVEIGRWLPIGINGGGGDVNGYAGTSMLLFGVTWTLSSEWKFYASLPLWAVIARRRRWHLPALSCLALFCIVYSVVRPEVTVAAPSIRCFLFVAGAVCATLERRGLLLLLPRAAMSALTLAILAIILSGNSTAYDTLPALGLALCFFLIISGADIFGLLASRPARRMGDVSYSIYLLQGLVTTLVFRIPAMRHFALQSSLTHWIAMCGCAVMLLLTSMLTYRFIERPGIGYGKYVAKRLSSPGRRPLAQPGGTAPPVPMSDQAPGPNQVHQRAPSTWLPADVRDAAEPGRSER